MRLEIRHREKANEILNLLEGYSYKDIADILSEADYYARQKSKLVSTA
ncbi:MAG: hypothetical protein KDC69_09215 [Flavobacteriaceae bacterium]|nr:hypothetical protein [Flavobacteriaceae bacterium]